MLIKAADFCVSQSPGSTLWSSTSLTCTSASVYSFRYVSLSATKPFRYISAQNCPHQPIFQQFLFARICESLSQVPLGLMLSEGVRPSWCQRGVQAWSWRSGSVFQIRVSSELFGRNEAYSHVRQCHSHQILAPRSAGATTVGEASSSRVALFRCAGWKSQVAVFGIWSYMPSTILTRGISKAFLILKSRAREFAWTFAFLSDTVCCQPSSTRSDLYFAPTLS